MSRVIALCSADRDAEALEPVAASLATAIGADVATHRLDEEPDALLTGALRAARRPGVRLVVLPLHPAGATTLAHTLLLRCSRPVVLVPTGARARHVQEVRRVLVPLDGSAESAEAVAGTLAMLAESGLDLVVLHVFDRSNVPRFWDQPVHAESCWEAEFLARSCPEPSARLVTRRGVAGQGILDVAEDEQADLVVLGWTQPSGAERARTVWSTVATARVPVLLMPVSPVLELAGQPVAVRAAR